MITLEDFIELDIKKITYKGNNYVIKFKKYIDINNDKYYICLFNENDYDCISNRMKYKFSAPLYELNLAYFLDNYVLESDISSHSPTYIQEVIELFFKEYLKQKEEQDKKQIEYKVQIKNYNEWDGVIKQ